MGPPCCYNPYCAPRRLCGKRCSLRSQCISWPTGHRVLGDLGEYDLILHVREESRDAAKAEIQKVISSGFKGAYVKEGPVVLGKSNFLVALPDQLRSRVTLENLAKLLGEVPGASGGVTFIIEPRLTLTGIESGAFYFLLNQAEKVKGGSDSAFATEAGSVLCWSLTLTCGRCPMI